ncbi:hypothetical protein [Citrobacter amalonaticus]|uniref:hypothetical protein n=1 Tax=Citrobacter amalonaticus TaxID=35703 RepID=UPI00300D5C2A
MDIPFKAKLRKLSVLGATGCLLSMEYEALSRGQKLLHILAYSLFIASFTFVITGGDPSKFSHPWFVVYAALVIISIQWPYLWRWHKEDLRTYGRIRRAGR